MALQKHFGNAGGSPEISVDLKQMGITICFRLGVALLLSMLRTLIPRLGPMEGPRRRPLSILEIPVLWFP